MTNINEIDSALEIGANKATIVARGVLYRVRKKLGYN
jgi:tryptophanyl-tRNA synthetase